MSTQPQQGTPQKLPREVRHVAYVHNRQENSDYHFIKEVIHHPDGRLERRTRGIENYKRPVWITKKGFRDHVEFKEWEYISRLDRIETRECDIPYAAAKALGVGYMRNPRLKELVQEMPYIYGADMSSCSILKWTPYLAFKKVTPYSVGVFDVETDVVGIPDEPGQDGSYSIGSIMMATFSFKNYAITAVQEKFVRGLSDPIAVIRRKAEEQIGHILKERNLEWEIVIVPDEIAVVKTVFAAMHKKQPDFVAVFNLSFDVKKVVEACQRADVDPALLFSDPSVPKKFKYFHFKESPRQRVTKSGRVLSFKPSQLWHTVTAPSSFYWVCSMASYRHCRQGSAELSSYSLESLLATEKIGVKKLHTVKETEDLSGLPWHHAMQSRFSADYVVYNLFDCIATEMLDEKTKDLSVTVPMFAQSTEFEWFTSMPKRAVNELFWFNLTSKGEDKRVNGTAASKLEDENDELTTDVKNWIVMLHQARVFDNGLRIIEGIPSLQTNVRIAGADLDVSAAYPTNELVFNVSRETTSKELICVAGIDEFTQRMQTINFSAGHVNAVEFCTKMLDMPSLIELGRYWDAAANGTYYSHRDPRIPVYASEESFLEAYRSSRQMIKAVA